MTQNNTSTQTSSRDRFLNALWARNSGRPPVWLMRQAGRYLPEYRELKAQHGFLKMAQTPELAAQVTLQPLQRFPQLDAAITFSDILVIPEALGQPYAFRDGGGIEMEYALSCHDDISKLAQPEIVREKLTYVPNAQKIIRQELGDSKALIGFGGSPWTLATYMIEGGSSKDYAKTKALALGNPEAFVALMEKLTDALIEYFKMQIEAGVDAIQIFDSWATGCPAPLYWDLSLRWITRIIGELPQDFPIIVFPKGMTHHTRLLSQTGARAFGADWTVSLKLLRQAFGNDITLQGNLDPAMMHTTPDIARRETLRILDEMKGDPAFIFNFGHGFMPGASIDCVQALLDAVTNYEA